MAMYDKNEIFAKYRNKVFDFKMPVIESYKKFLSNKKNFSLLEFALSIEAYDFGVRMQARKSFRNEYNNGDFKSFLEKDDSVYFDNNLFKNVIEQELLSFKSSFSNKRSERIKRININESLFKKVKIKNMKDYSLSDDFEKNFLPYYKELRRNEANIIEKKFGFTSANELYNLIFEEIIYASNKKIHTDDIQKARDAVRYLEMCLEKTYPIFLQDLGVENDLTVLKLRKEAKKKFNTRCYRCGKSLFKSDNRHYCTRNENRQCYEARIKESRESKIQDTILETKNKCSNCNKRSSIDEIHKIDDNYYQFCSSRCWETFRKRKFRQKMTIKKA